MRLRFLKITGISIICLFTCLILPVTAAENSNTEDLADDASIHTVTVADTIPPPLPPAPAPTQPLPQVTEPEETLQPESEASLPQAENPLDDSFSDEDKETDAAEPATNEVTAIPMPPLIEQPAKPSYSLEQQLEQKQQPAENEAAEITTDTINTSESSTPVSEEKSQTTKWTDTRPEKVSADWLQLTTGEWLRGRIIIMQEEDFEFDSDELKKLVFEWKKVRYLKSYEPYTLRFDGGRFVVGIIEVTQDKIHVSTDYDDQTFDRKEILSIASGNKKELSNWTNKVTFSVNVRRGNTTQTDFTSKISAKRRTAISRLNLDYLGNFTEIENTETINNHRLNGNYDLFISRNLFVTPIITEYYRDPFQNIEQRINAGVSIGYRLVNTYRVEWDASGGPAYQETRFVSVQAGSSDKDATFTLNLNTNFDIELNSKVDLEGSYSVTLGDDKTGNYNHHSILTIETELTDKLDFDVSMVWDRVRSPVPDENNKVPENDDFRIMIGLGYDL